MVPLVEPLLGVEKVDSGVGRQHQDAARCNREDHRRLERHPDVVPAASVGLKAPPGASRPDTDCASWCRAGSPDCPPSSTPRGGRPSGTCPGAPRALATREVHHPR
eukprot:scaffold184_cov316-Pinguiococcus_pyrenoidosus.AAC.21